MKNMISSDRNVSDGGENFHWGDFKDKDKEIFGGEEPPRPFIKDERSPLQGRGIGVYIIPLPWRGVSPLCRMTGWFIHVDGVVYSAE